VSEVMVQSAVWLVCTILRHCEHQTSSSAIHSTGPLSRSEEHSMNVTLLTAVYRKL
jgi:hypothetical protein